MYTTTFYISYLNTVYYYFISNQKNQYEFYKSRHFFLSFYLFSFHHFLRNKNTAQMFLIYPWTIFV